MFPGWSSQCDYEECLGAENRHELTQASRHVLPWALSAALAARVKKPHYESMYKTQQSSLVTQCRKPSSDRYLGSKRSGKYKIAKSKQNPRIIFPRQLKILAANVIPRISKPLFDVTVSWFATSRLQGNSHDISLTPTTCWSTLELSLHLALETILLILLI